MDPNMVKGPHSRSNSGAYFHSSISFDQFSQSAQVNGQMQTLPSFSDNPLYQHHIHNRLIEEDFSSGNVIDDLPLEMSTGRRVFPQNSNTTNSLVKAARSGSIGGNNVVDSSLSPNNISGSPSDTIGSSKNKFHANSLLLDSDNQSNSGAGGMGGPSSSNDTSILTHVMSFFNPADIINDVRNIAKPSQLRELASEGSSRSTQLPHKISLSSHTTLTVSSAPMPQTMSQFGSLNHESTMYARFTAENQTSSQITIRDEPTIAFSNEYDDHGQNESICDDEGTAEMTLTHLDLQNGDTDEQKASESSI